MNQSEVLEHLLAIIKDYLANQDKGSFVDYHDAPELLTLLKLDESEGEHDWNKLFQWVEKYLAYSVKTNHPGFVNRMWAGANLPSIVGEIVTAVSNTSSCTYESAPVSTLLEKYMIQKMLRVVGFTNGEGQMTTGSSNGNMIAMLAARNSMGAQIKKEGLCRHDKLLAYVSADSHYSMDKAANILGIGTDNLIKIPVNEKGEIAVAELDKQLAQAGGQGVPFFVGATAGTTVRGAYDPLIDLLQLRDKYNFWLHVDGAWGGSVVLSDNLREKFLPGIARVDSFTWDFHKMVGTNLMCNILLLNNMPNTFGKVCSAGDGSYIFREEPDQGVRDLGSISLQCGKRVDSLKWFLDWKFYGRRGLAARVEKFLELCEYAENIVNNTKELEMVAERESFNICFRFKTPENVSANDFNLKLRTALYQEGEALVGYGFFGATLALRLLIANSNFENADVDNFFANIVQKGNQLLGGGNA